MPSRFFYTRFQCERRFAERRDLAMDRRMGLLDAIRQRRPVLAAGMVGLAGGLPLSASIGKAQQSESTIICTNPASGASWQVTIDYGKATVDTNPAAITAATISWFDPKDGGHYRLDRKSGELTATVASSTGGYLRRVRCGMDPAR